MIVQSKPIESLAWLGRVSGFGLLLYSSLAWPTIKGAISNETPVFSRAQIHNFARVHLNALQQLSFEDNREYCGWIGFDQNGLLTATQAHQGNLVGCRLKRWPSGFKPVASYHTHGAFHPDIDTEVPSVFDLENDLKQKVNGYIATPGGQFWFNDHRARHTILLCSTPCIKRDPNFLDCANNHVYARYTLNELHWRAEHVTKPCF